MELHESGENYLETILILKKRNGSVRSIDIANELNFTKPSVSRAMSVLKKAGYIEVDRLNQILLTDTGKEIAENVYERHCVIKDYLISIGVNNETAALDACRIEHVISQESFDRIKEILNKNKAENN